MIEILAQSTGITGNITSAFGLLGAAIGVGMIGTKAAEAVGRNPGRFRQDPRAGHHRYGARRRSRHPRPVPRLSQ
jgi:hypothetical protein